MIHMTILILFDPKPFVNILLLRSYNIQYHSTEHIQSVTNNKYFLCQAVTLRLIRKLASSTTNVCTHVHTMWIK